MSLKGERAALLLAAGDSCYIYGLPRSRGWMNQSVLGTAAVHVVNHGRCEADCGVWKEQYEYRFLSG